ncbi:MAG TPA: RING finger protein [Planctomycetota bacterium]|nr:RING finger protein [Planctomycetota bacterium]
MELIVPIAIFAFAIYILGTGRRSATLPPLGSMDRGEWPVDYSRGRRVAERELEELKRTFGRFAEERDGRRLDRAPYEGPRVAYFNGSARAVLSLHVVAREDGGDDRFTQISYAVPPGWRHRIEVGPTTPEESLESPVPGLLRAQTGDDDFDGRTRILTTDPATARAIFDAPARRAMNDLRELLLNGHMHLSASSSRIYLRKRGVIRQYPDLALFARLCDSIYARLLTAWERDNGIEILEESPGPADEAPKCQVCSHPITADSRVRCRRCRTPHHPDCWEFNGGCATFACGEKQTLKGAA